MDNGLGGGIFSSPTPEGSVNESDWQRSLEISAPVDMPAPEQLNEQSLEQPKEQIATTEDAGLYSAENSLTPDSQTPIAQEAQTIKTPEDLPQLGQITPINQPEPGAFSQNYNPVNIKTSGDKLEKSTIPEVDNVIAELSQTGNLNSFYDEIRGSDQKPGMMEANLKNSYGRKLGEGA